MRINIINGLKLCGGKSGCKKMKPLNEFPKSKTSKNGRQSSCNECHKEYKEKIAAKNKIYHEEHKKEVAIEKKIYYQEHKEEINAKRRTYYHEHKKEMADKRRVRYQKDKEKINERNRKYREEHKEETKEYQKIYREEHKEEASIYKKKHYKENKDKKLEYQKIYYQEHREEVLEYQQSYQQKNKEKINKRSKKRRDGDVHYKIAGYLRGRIYNVINGSKPGSAVKDLGCSVKELVIYLQSQFYPNSKTKEIMTWENYGLAWHIDHVIPLGLFDLTDRKQFLKACHYTNLQPLWVEDHHIKTTQDRKLIKHERQPNVKV